MSGIRLLVADWHGVYIPQVFCNQFETSKWGIASEDVSVIADGPEADGYWDAWDFATQNASYKDEDGNTWNLYQDGDLWAFCVALMDDEEYENFFGERREVA